MIGRIYSLSFTEVAVTAQQDLFQVGALVVPSILHAVYLSQSSDVGDSAAENLSILIRKVTDAVTDDLATVALDGGDATQNANVAINETSELTTGIEVVHTETWNIAQTFIYLPPPELIATVKIGDSIVVNLNTTPADSITMSGTLYFEEFGS